MAEIITVSHLKRDPDFIKNHLQVGKDQVYAKKDLEIHIPKRYAQKALAVLGEQNYCVGIFPIVIDDKYAVMNLMSLIHLGASTIREVLIEEVEYYIFSFQKGYEVFAERDVVRDDNMTFNVFDEFISQGNIPWFIDYLDLANLYTTSDIYADSRMVYYQFPYEIMVSLISRSPKDRMKLYRYLLNTDKDLSIRPDYTQLKSVMYMSKSTVNKLAGSYMDEGVVSALVYPSQHVEKIEKLLRE